MDLRIENTVIPVTVIHKSIFTVWIDLRSSNGFGRTISLDICEG